MQAFFAVALFTTSAFAITPPDFPIAGFATQNGGSTGGKIIYVKPGTITVTAASSTECRITKTHYQNQGRLSEWGVFLFVN